LFQIIIYSVPPMWHSFFLLSFNLLSWVPTVHVQIATTQNLQWAISNASIGSFDYRDGSSSYSAYTNSGGLVKEVLLAFIRRVGMWLSNNGFCVGASSYNGSGATEATKKAFRDALSTQIFSLTGTKPRIQKEKNGDVEQWAIYRV